jgi:hypothetical protein
VAVRVIALSLAVVLSGGAQAAADVTFKNAQAFADATFDRPRSEKNRREVQDAVRKLFAELAEKYLAPGQTLAVEISDIDLAGRIEPAFTDDIRIMDSVAWPRIKFTYAVRENGALVASGQADIHDFDYLNGFNRYFDSDRLRYERQMLADWFRKTMARRPA